MICSYHQAYIPPEELEKSPVRTVTIKPLPKARPFAPVDTYETAEAEVFRLCTEYAVGDDTFDVGTSPPIAAATRTVDSAAWTALYMYALIAEARRPDHWIAVARVRLAACADFLLGLQAGGPSITVAASAAQYGGLSQTLTTATTGYFYTYQTAVAGLAFLRAYQALGDASYLAAALRCGDFLRTQQASSSWATTSKNATTDAAGTAPIYLGGFAETVFVDGSGAVSDRWYHMGRNFTALEFLYLLRTIAGEVTLGSATTTADFAVSRARTISTVILDAVTFWKVGAFDAATGTTYTGMSTTTPRERFNAYPTDKTIDTGTGAWEYTTGTSVSGYTFARTVRGLRAIGETTLAEALFDYLMTFTSASAYELATGYTEADRYAGAKGEYDPKGMLATQLNIPTLANSTSFYDLRTLGLMAPLYAARQAGTFAAVKNELNRPRPRDVTRDAGRLHLGTLAACGLAFQPFSAAATRTASVTSAAMVGLAYRELPGTFMGASR